MDRSEVPKLVVIELEVVYAVCYINLWEKSFSTANYWDKSLLSSSRVFRSQTSRLIFTNFVRNPTLQLDTKRTIDLVCRSSQICSVEAIFSLSVIGASVTGFDLETTLRLALVCAVASISGIFLLSPISSVSKDKIPELIAKGISVGVPAAALSHLLFLHSVLRPIGWLILRIGELFELRVGDIHQRERLLEVRQSKTCNGVRSIHLSENDLAVLREQIESLGDEQDDPNAILFRSPEGKPLHYRNLAQRVLKKVISDAGLDPFTFHDFRKTHATMLVAAGIDPKVVQDRMGHVDIKTTLEYYAQPTKAGKEAAAQVAMRYLTEQEEKSTDSFVYSDLVKSSSQ